MLLLATPPPRVLPVFDDPRHPHTGGWRPTDAALISLSLFTVWAIRTGRSLRPVPVPELTREELEDFWADDQLEPLLAREPQQENR